MGRAPDENIRFLQARRDEAPPFRVADLRGSEQNVDLAMHGLDIMVGHHPNDLARYRMLLGLQASVRQGNNSRHPNVLSLMNVKYLAWPLQAAGGPPWEGAQPASTARTPRGVEAVYAYPGLEKAWLAGTATVLDDDAALARILSGAFDPAREVVLAEPASLGPDPSVNGHRHLGTQRSRRAPPARLHHRAGTAGRVGELVSGLGGRGGW